MSGRLLVMSTTSCPPTIVVIVFVTASLLQQVASYRPYPDPGPDIPHWQEFCGTRPPGQRCCPNRVDTCTVPILDTLCYCDDFCDRTISDCCPDFWSECRGLSPQPFNASTTPRPPFTSEYTTACEFEDCRFRSTPFCTVFVNLRETCNLMQCCNIAYK